MERQLQAILTGLTRLTNTPSGNPRWMLITTVGTFRTSDDSQCAGMVSEAMVGQVLDLTVDGRSHARKIAVAA